MASLQQTAQRRACERWLQTEMQLSCLRHLFMSSTLNRNVCDSSFSSSDCRQRQSLSARGSLLILCLCLNSLGIEKYCHLWGVLGERSVLAKDLEVYLCDLGVYSFAYACRMSELERVGLLLWLPNFNGNIIIILGPWVLIINLIMANVHGINDLGANRGNNGARRPLIQDNDYSDALNQQVRNNKVPFMNTMQTDVAPMDQSIPFTLRLVWCPNLSLFSVTTFLLVAIWAVYIVCLTFGISMTQGGVLAPRPDKLNTFGALNVYSVRNGQVWRLVTAAFLHADLLHIVMNSISLLLFMSRLQKCYNSRIIAVLCLASALAGNITSVEFLKDNSISVGASTMIFGMLGGLLAYMTINWKSLGRLRGQLCCIIGIVVVFSMLSSLGGGVDLAGHLGGFFGGYACGLAIFPGIQPKPKMFMLAGGAAWAIYMLVMILVFYL